jgi:Arc/MetJ-type ribon-helix-helix transcriptional regulator
MSVSFTVRISRELYEKMKRFREINWSEVVRKAIEEYIERLEEGEKAVPAKKVVEELVRMGVDVEKLKPLSPEEEDKLYKELRERTWERIKSMIQVQ